MINMESAYGLAARELSALRTRNQTEQNRRIEEVRAKAPDYTDIEVSLTRAGTSLLRSVLNGGKDFEIIKASIQAKQAKKTELLRRLGLPDDYLDEIYSCPKCHDTGFDEDGRRCECLKQLTLKYIGKNSNLTEHMKAQTFDRFDISLFADQPASGGHSPLVVIQSAYEKCVRFANTFDQGHENILLLGNAGTGKTYLSSCIANRALERQKTVYYQTAFKLFELMEQVRFNKLAADELEQAEYTVRYVKEVDLLIIDDLGTEFITQFSAASLFDIINTRLTEGKSTILSSNLSFDKLEEIYSNRLRSRLAGDYDVIKLVGQDLRLLKKFKR